MSAQNQIDQLKAALLFYANARGYDVAESYRGGEFVGITVGDTIQDRGQLARDTLRQLRANDPREETPAGG